MYVEFNQSGHQVYLPKWLPTLAKQFGSGMMDEKELLYLASTIMLAKWENDSYICEIGTYIGLTSVFMAKVASNYNIHTTVLSIDPFERFNPDEVNPQGNFNSYLYNIKMHNLEGMCIPLACFSKDAARVLSPTISVLVIDGSHHYDDVSKDLNLYIPKVKNDGYIFIDDYVSWAYPGVCRAVDEYFSNKSHALLHKSNYVIYRKQK
ncbi:hypothetical protein SYNTR_2027 [Candidatus Syntrophocurvum alkaliphilum]|uniref:Class I SAM-dependent methyltransferase n=1 Tax=Candidatus Syntrophocurvum alkaliphilum TaxID=2293317 RepID=A0A6I6DNA9_9FIRM|nr:class I SAM-dependent methyltransferase [Candidatus Syntrophocurvum alkaliphilum]QGU00621.1 hypothetical protein SYNTR_2027 [Candidatus Syntrophocurvum alkaliphilum]